MTVATWNVPTVHKINIAVLLLSLRTDCASMDDIRALGELLSCLACQWIQLTPGLWSPCCSISVWLRDSRLKPTLIIPLVEHTDKVLFLFQIPLCWFILTHEKQYAEVPSNFWHDFFFFFVRTISIFFPQGEIGEKGQKVKTMFIHKLLFAQFV